MNYQLMTELKHKNHSDNADISTSLTLTGDIDLRPYVKVKKYITYQSNCLLQS